MLETRNQKTGAGPFSSFVIRISDLIRHSGFWFRVSSSCYNYERPADANMLHFAHMLLIGLYVALPPVALVVMFARDKRAGPTATVAIASSLLLGFAASIVYDLWLGAIVTPGQMVLTCYWIAALICLLKLLDIGFGWLTRTLLAAGVGSWKRRQRQGAAQALRVGLLFLVGLPYMIVAAATYRPKTIQRIETFRTDLDATDVSFPSTDGLQISGLWIAAGPAPEDVIPNPHWGRQTLLICPGSRGGKGGYLLLSRKFLDEGYNVLSFDFRGHGRSDGQIISFGDHERRDVLGAVRWLRRSQPQASERIVAVGIDTGGAALLAAAADPSPEGRSVCALAVVDCYDRFDRLVSSALEIYQQPVFRWLITRIGLPLACVQTGADLCDFSPAAAAARIAPRPIFFIHDRHNPVIDFDRGLSLFESASAPKSYLWLDRSDSAGPINDPDVADQTLRFLDTAVPML
jgi:pimeloyl-ACP methyl ester carboxylesterase